MQKILSFIVLVTILILNGCGGGSNANKAQTQNMQEITTSSNTVRLVDGYIQNAIVKDSSGQTATYTSNGNYVFENPPTGKVYVYGGDFTDSSVKNKFDYIVDSSYKIISPLTHYISQYPDEKTKFLNSLELSEKDINQDFVVRMQNDKVNTDINSVKMARIAQIFYALEVNDKLKNLKSILSYDDIYNKSLELVNNNKEATELIKNANSMEKEELINAENNLATIKNTLYDTSSKISGIRLEGKWQLKGTTTECQDDKIDLAQVTISYNKNIGYHISNYNYEMLGLGVCIIEKLKRTDSLAVLEKTYDNVKYPLPISDFENGKELAKLFVSTEFRGNSSSFFDSVTIKFISPDTFSNTSTYSYGGKKYSYTAIYRKVDKF